MKDWTERLNTPGINGIKPSPRTFSDVVEGQPMLVPTARQVDDFIRSIPRGVQMDVRALRTALALEHGAEVTCPVTKKLSFGADFVAEQRKREGLQD
jgi:hypothetical protein